MSKKHIGKILNSVAENHALPKVEIIRKAGYESQSTYYKHISQANLSFKILYKYAKAMDYGFSKELPEFKKWLEENNLPEMGNDNKELIRLTKEVNKWKEKHFELLEKYHVLLESHNKYVKELEEKLKNKMD